jgi:CBS domain containing-hemolysin-like protein
LAEIGEQLDVDLEHEEVETVGGLVMAQLERPFPGSEIRSSTRALNSR